MSNGVRDAQTVSSTIVTLEYPPANGLAGCTVTVADGLMTVNAILDTGQGEQQWNVQLPLVAAPLMLAIAQDMVAELQSEQAAQSSTTDTTADQSTSGDTSTPSS